MSPQRSSQISNLLLTAAVGLMGWVLIKITTIDTSLAVVKNDISWVKQTIVERLSKK
jgi:hypothetical protein